MKKNFYIALVLFTLSIMFSACTKEEVKPQAGDTPAAPIKE